MGAEMRGVFGDLRVSHFLQSREEECQCGWCMVLSFASVSLCLSVCLSLSWSLLVSSAFFWSVSAVEKFVFYIVFLFWLDQIGFSLFFFLFLFFLPRRSRIGRKITFNYFFFFLSNFIDILLFADPVRRNPFSPFWRKSQHR